MPGGGRVDPSRIPGGVQLPSPRRERSGTWRSLRDSLAGWTWEATGRGEPRARDAWGEAKTGMRKQREDRSKACQRTGDLWDVRAAEARSHTREPTVLRGKERGPLSSVFSVIVPNPERPFQGSWIEWSFQEFPRRGGKNMQAQIAIGILLPHPHLSPRRSRRQD